jgi:hypothetical protein
MENVIYRKVDENATGRCTSSAVSGLLSSPESKVQDWSPGTFYPSLSKEEMQVWKPWLPTAIVLRRKPTSTLAGGVRALEQLEAPKEVIDEFSWSWNMELFDEYELRTPERRDWRDPLLLGRCASQRYRIALWGESLRPFDEIADIVQRSLAVRARAIKHRVLTVMGSMFAGGALGLWMASQVSPGEDQIATCFSFTVLGLVFALMLSWLHSPERRQQDFLDHYRC